MAGSAAARWDALGQIDGKRLSEGDAELEIREQRLAAAAHYYLLAKDRAGRRTPLRASIPATARGSNG